MGHRTKERGSDEPGLGRGMVDRPVDLEIWAVCSACGSLLAAHTPYRDWWNDVLTCPHCGQQERAKHVTN